MYSYNRINIKFSTGNQIQYPSNKSIHCVLGNDRPFNELIHCFRKAFNWN